ncbi:CsbD family protein [Streptomyces sp. NPDC056144]|uniref:CsbD family protein n=1 Tax=unclassified Streptomyces TaxID=2593676 RepID=UPI0035E0073E
MASKAKGKMEQMKGKGKEAVGRATGNDRMKAEGKTDQAKGKAKEAMAKVHDSAQGVRDSLRDRK